jgi:acetoin utilization deacetylase AcuC-like enzyme
MGPGGRVLLITDPAMDRHAIPGHPERPERRGPAAQGVRDGAAAAGVEIDEPEVAPLDDAAITSVHPAAYLAMLDEAESRGGGWLDSDTYLVGGTMHAARLAAGATVTAARAVAEGRAPLAFAVVRPPGHHAAAARGSGFCILNNVAIAVVALRAAGLARRIAIVDWDVHHGDGTQAIFDGDPELCYTSTHQSPLYPGTGAATERGEGPAAGTKHNRPLPPGSGDLELLAAWRDDLLPAIAGFGPDAILVSAGYDAHRDDPLAALTVTDQGYRLLGRALGALATDAGLPGVALTLEGGYDLDALRASVAASVEGILNGLAAGPAA